MVYKATSLQDAINVLVDREVATISRDELETIAIEHLSEVYRCYPYDTIVEMCKQYNIEVPQ